MLNEDIWVFGLFGFPLSHSLSPPMQNAALKALGIPGIYLPFERNPKDFLRLIRSKKKMILDGFNATVPYKELLLPYLDWVHPFARWIGAVNTVKRVKNRYLGYNTDVFGFCRGLREAGFRTPGTKAVILGAGGAARAVIVGLAQEKVGEIGIANRTQEKARVLVLEFERKFPRLRIRAVVDRKDLKQTLQNADLLINATRVGLKKRDPVLVSPSFLPRQRILVYDLIYGPHRTKLLKEAERLGHQTLGGETMLLYQGARAFEIWTKRRAPVSVMQKALRQALHSSS